MASFQLSIEDIIDPNSNYFAKQIDSIQLFQDLDSVKQQDFYLLFNRCFSPKKVQQLIKYKSQQIKRVEFKTKQWSSYFLKKDANKCDFCSAPRKLYSFLINVCQKNNGQQHLQLCQLKMAIKQNKFDSNKKIAGNKRKFYQKSSEDCFQQFFLKFLMNSSYYIDRKEKYSQWIKKNPLKKQNIEKVQQVFNHLKKIKYLPSQLDLSLVQMNNSKLLNRIVYFQKISQNDNKVKKILMQLLLKYSIDEANMYSIQQKQQNQINEFIIDKSVLSDQASVCICCSKTVIDGINSHFLPFYSSIQQLANNQYPEYLICQVKHARILCSLLNQGEGCLIFGLKLKDSFNYIKKTKIKNYFTKFMTLFNKNSSKKTRKFVTKYLNELQKYIGIEGSNQEKTFNVVVEYVSVVDQEKNQLMQNDTQNSSFFLDEDNHNDQKYLIRVKVKALVKQKIYHVKRMYQQREIPQYWIRNSSGDLYQITGPNIYKFAKQIYKFQKKMQCIMQKKINNEINEMQVQNRILLSQKYSQKYQFQKENLRPKFLHESISFLLIISSHKQMYLFDQVKDVMKKKKISFVQSEPFIKYKGMIYQRYWIFSVLSTEKEIIHFIYQNFQRHFEKFYKVQNFIEVKLKKKQQMSPNIIQNLERLLVLQQINNKISIKEVQISLIFQFKSYESWIFALIYFKSRAIHVKLSNLLDIHKIKRMKACDSKI